MQTWNNRSRCGFYTVVALHIRHSRFRGLFGAIAFKEGSNLYLTAITGDNSPGNFS
ncbi:hypothetical protein ECE50_014740 [Chitinophaga sp. Mgbs1]|uniref:Uncharacterized protein n=1 Tax=Chitinophaga solisilvae TaxID=1233460 RepID=A0A9Q5GRB3_9BACT|nr:hypothetical protein [Chitinophaga solisilvae]